MLKLLKDLVTLIIGLIEFMLIFRFILKLLGANPASDMIAWLYDMTQPLLQPFLFAFPTPSIRGGFVLEFTTLFAIFAYAFCGYLIQELLDIVDNRTYRRR